MNALELLDFCSLIAWLGWWVHRKWNEDPIEASDRRFAREHRVER